MSIDIINVYVLAHGLLVVATGFILGLRCLCRRAARTATYRQQLALAYVVSLGALALPLVNLWKHERFFKSAAQIWAAPTMQGWASSKGTAPHLSIASPFPLGSMPLDSLESALTLAVSLGVSYLILRRLKDAALLYRVVSRAQVVRQYGRLRILTTSQTTVPFSLWVPCRYYIVVPPSLLLQQRELRLALRHEAQHHRHQDTKLLYVYQTLKVLFFFNPAAHLLDRVVLELQELACDEALVGRRGISTQAYCRCLLWVAETASRGQRHLVGTTSMAGASAAPSLKRRIEAMLTGPKIHWRRRHMLAAGTVSLALMAATAVAASSPVHDRRITMQDAQRLAQGAAEDDGFPVVVNDLVLEQLNRYLGTPDGRAYIKRSLAQMENYQEGVHKVFVDYRLPTELLAVPIVESGYRNLPSQANPLSAAGIWQFLPQTARNFGMRVDDQVDDRLSVATETDAAARLLGSLDLQFKDWGLALLAYNGGRGLVEKAIQETGTRDVWEIVRKGYESDRHYVAAVMAAVLIAKNPSILD